MRPPYLTGQLISLRPLLLDDKEDAAAWFDGPFPINASRAETFLKEDVAASAWGPPERLHLVIVRTEPEEIVGGVRIEEPGGRTGEIHIRIAPWVADATEVRAEALRLLVPWLRDEVEQMTITVPVPADESATVAVLEELGMVQAARLREHVARPGTRVDLLLYQALNPGWEVRDA